MYRSGIGNDSSFGTEFSSSFNVMTTDAIPSDRPENRFGLHRHPLACLMDDTRPTLPEEHRCALLQVQGDPDLRWTFGKTCSLPDDWTGPSAIGHLKWLPFFGMRTSLALSLRARISDASKLSSSSMSATMISPFQIHPHTIHTRRRFQAKLSHQTGGVLTGLWQRSDDTQPFIRKGLLSLSMVLHIAFHMVFSHPTKSLVRSADSNNIPWNPPTIFRPSLIATPLAKVPSLILRTALPATTLVSAR